MSLRNRLILLARRIDRLDPPKKKQRTSPGFVVDEKDQYLNGFYYGTLMAQEEIWKWVQREPKKASG